MIKTHIYRDILAISALTILSLIYLIVPALNEYPITIIPYFLILLFLPGYSLISALNPSFNRARILKRVVFSINLSLIITLPLVLLSFTIPINLPLIYILSPFIIIMAIIAALRRRPQADVKKSSEPKIKDTPPRRGFSYLDLLLVIIITALCALFVLEPTLNKTVVRTVLGLLLVLFLPGYALIASLFPKKDDLDTIERLALSFGLSIAITPLIGLALNYTPFGIRLDPILISLTSVTVLLCAVAYLRRRRIPEDNRLYVDFGGFFRGVKESFKGESKAGKILSVVLILSI
ncbi:MAG TPA: DUF1616 domain-containing protein, partial [Methanobacterium sp.]